MLDRADPVSVNLEKHVVIDWGMHLDRLQYLFPGGHFDETRWKAHTQAIDPDEARTDPQIAKMIQPPDPRSWRDLVAERWGTALRIIRKPFVRETLNELREWE